MNDNIQKLYENASLVDSPTGTRYSLPDEFVEKFAELIVRECADVGSKFSQAHPEDICYQIKRHFGVTK